MRAAWPWIGGALLGMAGCAGTTAPEAPPARAAPPPQEPPPAAEPERWPKPELPPVAKEPPPAVPAWACSCHPFLQQLLAQRRADEAAGTPGTTKRVGWDALDLQVAAADPFQGLDDAQRRDALAYVAWKLAERDRSAAEAKALTAGAADAAVRLLAAGRDPDVLWRRARQLQLIHRTARLQAMTAKWHGRTIRLTGYVIPLERTADGITEFLLLPEPPPADRPPAQGPTQVVTVTTGAPLADADAAGAVTVEGRITVGGELPVEVPLPDGREPAVIRSGYLLEAQRVARAESK